MLRALPSRWILALVCTGLLAAASARTQSHSAAGSSASSESSAPDPKKAKRAYDKARRAEEAEDWQAALEEYAEAVKWSPDNREYLLRRDLARSRLVRQYVERAERDAVAGRMEEARGELRAAVALDPGDAVARERLEQLGSQEPSGLRQLEPQLAGEVHLQPQPGKHTFDYRGDTQGAYTEVARQFGVSPAFDVDLRSRPVRLRAEEVDFATAMSLLGAMTRTFWRPLTSHLFFIAEDTPQKRREYDASVVRTVVLPSSATPDQMNETLRVVRDIAGIARSQLDTSSRTLTMRASPQAIALAAKLLDELEQASGEMILELEILEVDRNKARQLGITPPETTTLFGVSSQQLQLAQQSAQGLTNVLAKIFGTPSSLSGLSNAQIGTLVGSGQIGLSSLIPPLLAFGGGKTTFFATLPGAVASFSDMLSLVRSGRRILLRAQDGKPTTFFVGDRVPISLALFSASLGSSTFVPGVTPGVFPTSSFATGTNPVALITGHFNSKSTTDNTDLAVVNQTDKTVSIFLGNGGGTFTLKSSPATGVMPVAIVARDFNGDGQTDLAVVNQGDATHPPSVSILLGNGDGTFSPGTTLTTGKMPAAIVTGEFNNDSAPDLAVVNEADNTVSIFLGHTDASGRPDGTFLPKADFSTGLGPVAIATGDFNNDGAVDLAVVNQTDKTVSILLGDKDAAGHPNGTFTAQPNPLATGAAPAAIALTDFNNDTFLDIAVANHTDNTASIFLGKGDGTFSAQTTFPTGAGPISLAIGDFNIDARSDIAVANQSGDSVSVLIGVGDGTFAPKLDLPAGSGPIAVVSADFNGDSRIDLAIADQTANQVTVILNSASFVPPTTSPSQTLFPGSEYMDLGLKVKATPRLHQDDEVTLQLQFEIRSLAGQSVNGIPIISNRTVEQTVRLREDETTVLSGILQRQEMRTVSGSPGLANLTGIGYLTGNRSTQYRETELLILITPRMVRLAPRANHSLNAGHEPSTGAAGGFRGEPGTPP